ncbi:MAG: glutathione S-transferase [Gammaproteobacteria bacterium]|nr:glutathione S-transferase [Gammaproteobacteria bacterium]
MKGANHDAIRLHGHPVSTYFNIARAALIEKGVNFEVVMSRARQDPEFLNLSPMGKIPVLETPHGWIAETIAILEYLEETLPAPALYPPDPLLRARGRQIINIVQMYVDAQVRNLYPGVFFGRSNDEATVAATRVTLDRATQALSILMKPAPFALGRDISHADVFAFYCLDIADRVTRFVYARSLLKEIGTLTEWSQMMAARASAHAVFADFYPAFVAYLAGHEARYDCRADTADVVLPPAAVIA